jgi:hypothetical protein
MGNNGGMTKSTSENIARVIAICESRGFPVLPYAVAAAAGVSTSTVRRYLAAREAEARS